MVKKISARSIASVLISLVCVLNIQAGLYFYFNPQKFTAAYELTGIPGEISVAGVGLLFIMWNIPYFFALYNPIKFKISLIQANIMQIIGVIGETALLFRFSHAEHPQLANSLLRFIIFDSVGLLLLFLALFVICFNKKTAWSNTHAV